MSSNPAPYRVICSSCGARYAVADETSTGKRCKCKRCGVVFVASVVPVESVKKPVNPTPAVQPNVKISTMASKTGIVLNPNTPFPLTVFGVEGIVVKKLRTLINEDHEKDPQGVVRKIAAIVAVNNLRCKEIDDYVNQFKPIYLQKIGSLKQKTEDWATASEEDRADLLEEFQEEAAGSLDVRPDCDIALLFECNENGISETAPLIEKYGFEHARYYLTFADNIQRVHVAGKYDQGNFEALVALGLAVGGDEVSPESILPTLTVKGLNEVASGLAERKFRHKAEAIDFLKTVPDLKERLAKMVDYRRVFMLLPLPASLLQINIARAEMELQYARLVADLLVRTFSSSKYATRELQQEADPDLADLKIVKELWPIGDCDTCPYCKRMAALEVKRQPKPPLHVGCRCSLINME